VKLVGRIVEYSSGLSWVMLDRAVDLPIGSVVRLKPAEEASFRAGEARTLGALGYYLHFDHPLWAGVPAVAERDLVYLVDDANQQEATP
jgi:hypothetical protein